MSDKQPKVIVDRRAPPPPPPPMDAEAGMKIALTVLALAALPVSAWLYISTYVEERVERGMSRQAEITAQLIDRQKGDIDSLQIYVSQLCAEARKANPSFSCSAGPVFSFPRDGN